MKIQMTEADEFGQSHPVETPEVIAVAIAELEEHVDKMQEGLKVAYKEASGRCPDQVERFKLKFLRSEVFRTEAAAKRMVKYWDKRLETFGPERAFLPPTQEGLFQGIERAMERGFVTVLPEVKDPSGRGVILLDPSKQDFSQVPRIEIIKAVWYSIHACLEDEETQKKGVIGLICPKHAKISQHDSKFDSMLHSSVQGVLPIRISCIALCHAPFLNILWPIIRMVLSKRLRQRVRVIGGKDEMVLKDFQQLGLSRDKVPQLIGGDLRVNHHAWLNARRQAGK